MAVEMRDDISAKEEKVISLKEFQCMSSTSHGPELIVLWFSFLSNHLLLPISQSSTEIYLLHCNLKARMSHK